MMLDSFSYSYVIYKLSYSIDGIQIQMLEAPAVEKFANAESQCVTKSFSR